MSPEVKKIYEMVGRIMENEIRNQAPSSRIASGTTVVTEFTEDGVAYYTVIADKVKYGVYLDKGTGQYYTAEEGPFNPNPGKGQDGIRPRFWTSLSDTFMERINTMIEEGLLKAQEQQFEEELQKL